MGEVKEGEGGGGGGEAGEEREVGTVLGGYVTRLKWEGWGAELGGGGGGGGQRAALGSLGGVPGACSGLQAVWSRT